MRASKSAGSMTRRSVTVYSVERWELVVDELLKLLRRVSGEGVRALAEETGPMWEVD